MYLLTYERYGPAVKRFTIRFDTLETALQMFRLAPGLLAARNPELFERDGNTWARIRPEEE